MTEHMMWVAIAGLAALSAITRSFFFISARPLRLPAWVERGLKYAPLAALAAIIAPEIWQVSPGGGPVDAKWIAAPVAAVWAWWRRDMLTTILVGMVVYLSLKLGVGW